MGWQYVNTLVKRSADDDIYTESTGYLIGDGYEEGFLCFKRGPWHRYSPYISQEWSPHIEIDGTSYYLQDFTFNGKKVFGSLSTPVQYVFWSESQRSWVTIVGGGIREPYYYTDLDEVTVLGDAFYAGDFPDLNDSIGETWNLGGNNTTGSASSTTAKLLHDYWEWFSNGSVSVYDSALCGKYRNTRDGSYKFVGIPAYKAVNNLEPNSYYNGEIFYRSWEQDSNGKWVYEGSNGHTIRYRPATRSWVLGTYGSGVWSEATTEPSMQGDTVRFAGWKEGEGGVHEEDGYGTFDLTWDHMDGGETRDRVLVGEASLWRCLTTE